MTFEAFITQEGSLVFFFVLQPTHTFMTSWPIHPFPGCTSVYLPCIIHIFARFHQMDVN